VRSLLTAKPHKSSWGTKNLYNMFTRFLLPIPIMLCWESSKKTFWKLKNTPIPFSIKTPTNNSFDIYIMHIQNFFLYFIFLSNKDHKGSFPSHLLSSPMSCLDLGSPLPSFMFVVSSLFPITCLETSLSTNQFEVSEYWHRFSYNTFIVKVLVLFRASLQSWKLSTSSSLPPWSCLLSF